jgi:3-oxoacyl-[acyl-carrier-protein] synthase-1
MSGGLDILSAGMVTAVGLDAPSSCAAMRAGLDGFRETGFRVAGGEFLVGAGVPLPKPWIGERRLAHLAAGAIVEAFEAVPDAVGQTALILCLAEEERAGRPVPDAATFLRRIGEIVETRPSGRSRLVAHGRPSGHVALAQARQMLAAREARYVMICGVDSYLTTGSVAAYLGGDRLLAPGAADGFIPGEAAAAILCGPPGSGRLRLEGLGLSREVARIRNPEDLPLRGDGMAAAYRAALGEAGLGLHDVAYRISDLIGEKYWFKQTALAMLRVMRKRREFQDLWSPAESIGNVGAAVVPIMAGLALTADRKGYAPGDTILIEASSDSGACAAAVFTAGRSA